MRHTCRRIAMLCVVLGIASANSAGRGRILDRNPVVGNAGVDEDPRILGAFLGPQGIRNVMESVGGLLDGVVGGFIGKPRALEDPRILDALFAPQGFENVLSTVGGLIDDAIGQVELGGLKTQGILSNTGALADNVVGHIGSVVGNLLTPHKQARLLGLGNLVRPEINSAQGLVGNVGNNVGNMIGGGLGHQSFIPQMGQNLIGDGLNRPFTSHIGTFIGGGLSRPSSSHIGTFIGGGLNRPYPTNVGTFIGGGLPNIPKMEPLPLGIPQTSAEVVVEKNVLKEQAMEQIREAEAEADAVVEAVMEAEADAEATVDAVAEAEGLM